MLNLLTNFILKFRKQSVPKQIQSYLLKHSKGLLLLAVSFGVYLVRVFSNMFYRTTEGAFIGHPNAWSDWALHISLTQIFATKPPSEWFIYHPYFAHGKLTYGFLSHLLTGLLVKIGMPIESAFLSISIILTIIFLTGLYYLYSQISKQISTILLGIFIFFTSSGLGIFRFTSQLNFSNLFHPQEDFTRYTQYQWLAGNIPAAMLIPQRAFFIGVSIGVWVLAILLTVLQNKKIHSQQKKLFLLIAGILAGLLPIAHMHSFITVVVVSATVILSQPILKKMSKNEVVFFFKELSWYVLPATVLSNVLFFSFVYGGIEVDPFMKILVGWTNTDGLVGWITMWLKLWGVFLPLVLVSGYLLIQNKKATILQSFFLGFVMLFILGNLIQFQPTAWDNTKLFAWVYLGFAIYVAKILVKILHSHKKQFLNKILVLFLIILLSASGLVELIRLQSFKQNTFQLNSSNEISTAQELQTLTQTDAVFLTALQHNHPVSVWAARPMFLGYLGWVTNFGFNADKRTNAAHDIYAGKPLADTYIKKYKISFIYLSNREKTFYQKINDSYLNSFPVFFENSTTTVFDTRHLWQ